MFRPKLGRPTINAQAHTISLYPNVYVYCIANIKIETRLDFPTFYTGSCFNARFSLHMLMVAVLENDCDRKDATLLPSSEQQPSVTLVLNDESCFSSHPFCSISPNVSFL